MITRSLSQYFKAISKDNNKALILSGARQTGKTSLLKMLYAQNGDEIDVQRLFENISAD